VPFNSIPSKDFVNRESDIDYLKRLAGSGENSVGGNLLLEGARGMGKTELLKQLYRILFWENGNVIPFYYSLRRATLKANHFARDYFTRFVRQYLAHIKKDPSLAENMSVPLAKLMPVMYSLKLRWLIDLVDDFEGQTRNSDPHDQILGAISAPLTAAARSGRTVLIMLDDFHMANQLYEINSGDLSGPASLFDGSINTSLCPHILTGSPEGILESLFTDNSFRGKAERMFISPLPEDVAHFLFSSLCDRLGIRDNRKVSLKFMNFLGGNPLYIRNMVKSLRKMQKKEITERDLWECYSYEVSQGETFFYWSSVLGEFVRDVGSRRMASEILTESTRSDADMHDAGMLSKALGVPESSLVPVLDAVNLAGMVQPASAESKDYVLQDFIHSLHMREVEGVRRERARELIQSKYFPSGGAVSCFEMVIPMASDAELVAAKAVEQICKNINLSSDVTDQIQLALIESCINAVEHSGSYDKRIFLKFSVSPDKLEIIIESPGKFFQPDIEEPLITEKRLSSDSKRGWGFKLMRKIMDDVRIERLADRTRVILTKNIKPNEVLHESNEF
jgi:anti-sigma regulatory factor (Ser/Thr protein kinase)